VVMARAWRRCGAADTRRPGGPDAGFLVGPAGAGRTPPPAAVARLDAQPAFSASRASHAPRQLRLFDISTRAAAVPLPAPTTAAWAEMGLLAAIWGTSFLFIKV